MDEQYRDAINHEAQLDGSIAWDGGSPYFHASRYAEDPEAMAYYRSCYADYMKTKAMCSGG